uniref:Glycerol-3-phosphate acyltransferase 4 n=1 Tax=Bos mutus grunniens TaxID=30521 RepID=A0A8B9X6N5_BOSMU
MRTWEWSWPSQPGADGEDHLRPALFSGGGRWPGLHPHHVPAAAFDSLIVSLLGISLTVLFTLLLVFIIVPAVFGVSFGIRKLYMKTLLKIFAWATLRMERGAKEKNHQLYKPYTNGIIAKDPTSLEEEIKEIRRSGSSKALDNTPEFELSDIFYFCRKGMETIMDDEVTKRFSAEELESWNLLSRTNYNFQYISLRLTVLWGLGVLIRYCLLLPLRIALAFTGISLLVVGTTMVGYLPNGRFKEFLSKHVHLMCYRICVRALTAIITYHDRKNRPRNGGICVANHTSPIDVIILASDGYYAMVGQVHGGLMGVIQRAMVKACPHVWFERSEVKDRHLVARRLTEHVQDKSKLPILIFPEGTCINNTSVMMFKKGSFEIGATVYPVAIKYDPQFGDAFWNSSKYGMVTYLLRMMTSWAIVCSVWYLPPMTRQAEEDAVQFANRVKSAIARQGGLVDLLWDGGLKREKVKDTFKEEQQKLYSKMIVGNHEDRSRS